MRTTCYRDGVTRGVQVIIPHRDDVKIQSVVVSLNYLAVFERVDGLQARLHGCTLLVLGESGTVRCGLEESLLWP